MIRIKFVAIYLKPLIVIVLLRIYNVGMLAESWLQRKACHCGSGGTLSAIDSYEKYAVFPTRKSMQMLNNENAGHHEAQLDLDGLTAVIKGGSTTQLYIIIPSFSSPCDIFLSFLLAVLYGLTWCHLHLEAQESEA